MAACRIVFKNMLYRINDPHYSKVSLCSYSGPSRKITIPEEITFGGLQYTVNGIEPTFDFEAISDIDLPDSIRELPDFQCRLTHRVSVLWKNGRTEIGPLEDVFDIDHLFDNLKKEEAPASITVDGVEFSNNMRVLIRYPEDSETDHYAIPAGVSCIARNAFRNCNVKTIKVPRTVIDMDIEHQFHGCSSLERVDISKDNLIYSSDDGVVFSKGKRYLLYYPEGRRAKRYAVPEGTMCIGYDSFRHTSELEHVILPDTVIDTSGIHKFSRCAFTDIARSKEPAKDKEETLYIAPSIDKDATDDQLADLGTDLIFGHYSASDSVKKGYEIMKDLADRGNPCAYRVIGLMHDKDFISSRISGNVDESFLAELLNDADDTEYFAYMLKATELGDHVAPYCLGDRYRLGKGCERSKEIAIGYYIISAERGYETAYMMLSSVYLYDGSYADALKWSMMAADLDENNRLVSSNGYLALGDLYRYGLGVNRDIGKTIEYFERSAELSGTGFVPTGLSELYLIGDGVEQSYSRSEYWDVRRNLGHPHYMT